jgi:hypothetical protein
LKPNETKPIKGRTMLSIVIRGHNLTPQTLHYQTKVKRR